MTELELKRCPFCNYPDVKRSEDQGNYRFYIYCPDCLAHGPIAIGLYCSRIKWNTRK